MANISSRKERGDTLVAVVGPTASGKSDLGVYLAKEFNGEVVSADSRQVYKGLDIGSGKITSEEMMGIPHHLLDVVFPKRKFSVAQYQQLALTAIKNIQKNGKLPVLVGGSPFYIYAVVEGYALPEVKPNMKLRAELEKETLEELLIRLEKLDPERVTSLSQSSGQDKNKRRLIRALEIVLTTGKPVPKLDQSNSRFHTLLIGVKRSPEELKTRIHTRLLKRVEEGMIKEVEQLHCPPPAGGGLSWKRLEELGLEYRFAAKYLQHTISYEEMVSMLEKEIHAFARRQMVWFKKDARIRWVDTQAQARHLVENFLS